MERKLSIEADILSRGYTGEEDLMLHQFDMVQKAPFFIIYLYVLVSYYYVRSRNLLC